MVNLTVPPPILQKLGTSENAAEGAPSSLSAGIHGTLNKDLEKAVHGGSLNSKASTMFERSTHPRSPRRQFKCIRHARHAFFNVYRRLFTVVFLFNIVGLAALHATKGSWLTNPPLSDFATAAAGNIMVALLIRQDYVVNAVFKATWLVQHSAPLRLRRILAKAYEYGGIHSGAAVSSMMWFLLLTGFLTREFVTGNLRDPALLALTYVLITILLALTITAYPALRFSSHNTFENVHRWGGWISLLIFWFELVIFTRSSLRPNSSPLIVVLLQLPAFWFLFISTFHTILPWLRLHKMYIGAERLSSHVIRLHFLEPIPQFVGLRISSSPLTEWHTFAAIPDRGGGRDGGSLLISHAGDFTRSTIDHPQPYYYIKGIPVTGVLCMTQLFRSVIIITTGSGIGPCLAVIQDVPRTKIRVIWSTRKPLETYGREICKMVKGVDQDALIWDTRVRGRPDLLSLAWEMYHEEDAEAVFVLSNPALTRKVVFGLESRGVPAFGPVWDS